MALLPFFGHRASGTDQGGLRDEPVFCSPGRKSLEDGLEFGRLRGGRVFDARWDLGVRRPREEPRAHKALESVGQGVGAELQLSLEVDEASRFGVCDEDVEDVEDVLLSEQVKELADLAALGPLAGRFRWRRGFDRPVARHGLLLSFLKY